MNCEKNFQFAGSFCGRDLESGIDVAPAADLHRDLGLPTDRIGASSFLASASVPSARTPNSRISGLVDLELGPETVVGERRRALPCVEDPVQVAEASQVACR